MSFRFIQTIILCVLCVPFMAVAEEPVQVEFQADQVRYESPYVMAEGNVLVEYEGRSLRTPFLRYNQQTDEIDAQKSIFFEDEFGNRYFAKRALLNRKMETGEIHNISGTTVDNAFFSAEKAQRQSDARYVLEEARYSPCHACVGKEKKIPFWQLAARKVMMDQANETIRYKDAALELLGVPVFYLPYFFHPTPGASRRSGFLIPEYRQSNILGGMLRIPYYVNIKPEMDMTIAPILTSNEGPILTGEFRHLTKWGKYEFSGSATYPERRNVVGLADGGREWRGHIKGSGRFSLPHRWFVGFDGKRASDDTYLGRYGFGAEDLLTTVGYADRIWDKNYIGGKLISFQGLNVNDDPDITPFIAPLIEAHMERTIEVQETPITVYNDLHLMQLYRRIGTDSYRAANQTGVTMQHITQSGVVLEGDAHLYADAYHVNDFINGSTGQVEDGSRTRLAPALAVEASWPLMRHDANMTTMLTPRVMGYVSESDAEFNQDVPNEDSLTPELSDLNLFNYSRFAGVDRRELGTRVTYGLEAALLHNEWRLDGFLGQTYYKDGDVLGLAADDRSDIVGRVGAEYMDLAKVSYRFLAEEETGHIRKHELDARITHERVQANAAYVFFDTNNPVEEIHGGVNVKLYKDWRVYAGARRDIEGNQWINNRAGIVYDNDCFELDLGWQRTFVRDRDIEPSSDIKVKFTLKSLGKE